MEKFNFKGGENILKSICWILSYLSWLLVAVNNLASLKYMYKERQIWGIGIIEGQSLDFPYTPIQMDRIVIYIVYNIWILISFIGCVVFIVKTLFRKDNQVIDGMMGKFSQFHFFPLLCAFIMSILGEITDVDNGKHIMNTGLAFSLFGTASMVFIYIMTDFKTQDWWAEYTLKKGTFSCLIILFFYNFCYDIYLVGENENSDKNFAKNCGIAFSIIFGIGSLAFSVVFKDIILSFMNFLINIGMAKYYFELGDTSTKDYNKNADGAFDIIISILSLIWFLYLVIGIFMEEVQKLKQQVLNINQVQTLTIAKVNTNSEQINLISSNVNIPANNFGATDKN